MANVTNGNGERRAIISRDSLVPVGVVISMLFFAFLLGSQWTARGAQIENVKARTKEHETRIKLLESGMVFWRREVERKLGPLPDFKPNAISNDEGDSHVRRRADLQTDQMQRHGSRADKFGRLSSIDGPIRND